MLLNVLWEKITFWRVCELDLELAVEIEQNDEPAVFVNRSSCPEISLFLF